MLFETRYYIIMNTRHKADNGQTKPSEVSSTKLAAVRSTQHPLYGGLVGQGQQRAGRRTEYEYVNLKYRNRKLELVRKYPHLQLEKSFVRTECVAQRPDVVQMCPELHIYDRYNGKTLGHA
jgi:hypothetical protein